MGEGPRGNAPLVCSDHESGPPIAHQVRTPHECHTTGVTARFAAGAALPDTPPRARPSARQAEQGRPGDLVEQRAVLERGSRDLRRRTRALLHARQRFGARALAVGDGLDDRTVVLERDAAHRARPVDFRIGEDEGARRGEGRETRLSMVRHEHRTLRQAPELMLKGVVDLEVAHEVVEIHREQLVNLAAATAAAARARRGVRAARRQSALRSLRARRACRSPSQMSAMANSRTRKPARGQRFEHALAGEPIERQAHGRTRGVQHPHERQLPRAAPPRGTRRGSTSSRSARMTRSVCENRASCCRSEILHGAPF